MEKMSGETIGMANTWGRIAELFPYAVCGSYFAGKINKLQNKTRNVLPFLFLRNGLCCIPNFMAADKGVFIPRLRAFVWNSFFMYRLYYHVCSFEKTDRKSSNFFITAYNGSILCIYADRQMHAKMIAFEMNDIAGEANKNKYNPPAAI